MDSAINPRKSEIEQIIKNLKDQLSRLRTGRAHPDLVEGLMVDAYGVKTPLKQLAGISVSDSKTIVIQPWDRNIAVEIEKSIKLSDIGINPVGEGGVIRLNIPSLTGERRKEIVSVLHHKLETARIAVRGMRDEVRKEIMEKEKDGGITEDDKYQDLEELDKMTENYTREIKEIGDAKEEEIMTL